MSWVMTYTRGMTNTQNGTLTIGAIVSTTHVGDTRIYGKVIDLKARGMYNLSAVLVDWTNLGPCWESPESLTVRQVSSFDKEQAKAILRSVTGLRYDGNPDRVLEVAKDWVTLLTDAIAVLEGGCSQHR